MSPRPLLVVPLLACAFLVAGCGGAKKSAVGREVFTRPPVIDCLRSKGFTVSTREQDMNFIAYTATGGGLRAWRPKKHRKLDLILAFGRSGLDARHLMQGIKRFALRPPIFRYRLRIANVVILWAYHPSDANQTMLRDCLNRSVGK